MLFRSLAERYFGKLGAVGEVPDFVPPEPQAPLIVRNRRSLQQVHLCLGVPMFAATHPLRFAAYTMNVVLGGGMSSRLFQNIRERQGLVYSIFSEMNMYRDTGMMAVYGAMSGENTPRVVENVMQELRRLKRQALPAKELRHAKDHMKGSLMLSLESTSSRMGNLARQWMNYGRFFTLDELAASIESVTADEVQTVANEFFETGRVGMALLGRLDGAAPCPADLAC